MTTANEFAPGKKFVAQEFAATSGLSALDPDGAPVMTDQDGAFEHVGIGTRVAKGFIIFLPFAGLVTAIYLLWGYGVGWTELALMTAMYLVTGLGITIGYHRYFTHRSFDCPRWVQWVLAISGSMAMQGPLNGWVATHRCHHQHSDRPGDPHSPHIDHDHDDMFGHGIVGTLKGMWHSHMGWLFMNDVANLKRYIPDLDADPMCKAVSRYFGVWVVLGLLIPAAIGGAVSGTWWGAFLGLLWGGLLRIHVVHHITWSINSACHLWGGRMFRSPDHSRNNVLFGILAFGEGWHNNHHAFPASARHGLAWWQFDSSYVLIKIGEKLGLTWNINTPRPERMAAKRETARQTPRSRDR